MSRQLADLLLKDKLISGEQLLEAQEASKTGSSYVRFLIEKKYVSETKLLYYLSKKFGLPSINITKFEVSPDVIKLIPIELAKRCQVIPIQSNQGTLVVAMCDPTYMSNIETIKYVTKMNIEPLLTSYSAFDAAQQKYYGGTAYVGAAVEKFVRDKKPGDEDGSTSMLEVQVHDINQGQAAADAPVIQLVNGIFDEGIKRGASDIHVEPYEKKFRVRMRIDGVLQEIAQIPTEMKRAVTSRIKIMARMNIAETRLAQDGRIKLTIGGKEVDFRVNSMPTLFGEKICLRMLAKGNLQLDLLKLGFEAKQLEVFKKGIYSPNGMVLVTGPTGSGKTTTLYSALAELNQVTENLSTAEDPVEYNLEGINQVQVNKEIGLSFASVLRALLRQDPDVILVGEIRDIETAEVGVQAALTGHLVLSTLHTNDAASTITRLINMGIEPFLVVGAVNTVVAQRLLRTICTGCKEEEILPKERLAELGFTPQEVAQIKCYKGKGCQRCNQSGYKGRVAIYEVFDLSQTIKEMILKNATMIDLKKQAIKEGMKSLRMSALTKMLEGRTTLEEALGSTMEN